MTAWNGPASLACRARARVASMLARSPSSAVRAPETARNARWARSQLRACRTTSWPSATSRRAASCPSPSAEPVIKMRAMPLPPRRALADPLQDHDRNLPRGLSLVLPEPWRDRDALGIHALPFLALRLVRPHLERLGAVLRPHLHPRHGIRLEVVVPPGMVRRSALRCDDNVPFPVAVEHHRRDALVSASRPHGGEQHQLVPERSYTLPSLGMELLDGRLVPVRHHYLLPLLRKPFSVEPKHQAQRVNNLRSSVWRCDRDLEPGIGKRPVRPGELF